MVVALFKGIDMKRKVKIIDNVASKEWLKVLHYGPQETWQDRLSGIILFIFLFVLLAFL